MKIFEMGILFMVFSSIFANSTDANIPFKKGYLQVSNVHQIFYSIFGNPDGIPVVVLHGGPGSGCSSEYQCFDLKRYKVITFDQRGAMNSKPFACMEENTTQDLIEDIEQLKKKLGIEKWLVFGGSWGSLLGVLYGQEYPDSCLGFVFRAIFLGREQDLKLFDNKETMTKPYKEFIEHFSKEERENLLLASYRKIMNPEPKIHMDIAKAFIKYHFTRTNIADDSLEKILQNDKYVLSLARSVLHYASNNLFLQPNQVLFNMKKIAHLPAIIIHGNFDINCKPEQAKLLHKNWGNSRLWVINEGGHSAKDHNILSATIKATEKFADEFKNF